MEESKNPRPTSAPANKHMVVITPKQAATGPKAGKPKKKGTLEPVKKAAATATAGNFPKAADLDSHEKQKLKLLAGNPLKLDELFASLKEKERHFDEEARKKEDKLQRLQDSIQALINRKTEDGSPLVDFSASRQSESQSPGPSITSKDAQSVPSDEDSSSDEFDLSQSSTLLESIDSALSSRAAARDRIQTATEALLAKLGEDGEKLVQMPEKTENILQMVYEMQSLDRTDVPENCIEAYEKRAAIIRQNERNQEEWEKIRQLDLIIDAKERELRAVEGIIPSIASSVSSSTDRPTFVTHYKKSVSVSSAKMPDKVQRNLELAGRSEARYSMVERLQKKEKDRLMELEAGVEPSPALYDADMRKIALIDEKLKAFVPKEKWEERSIQSYPTHMPNSASDTSFNTTRSALTAPTVLTDAKPGEKELQDLRERREARERLDAINQSLMSLAEQPVTPLSDFDLQKLLCQADEAIVDSQAFIASALLEERTSALETGKQLLAKLEGRMGDDEDIDETLRQAEAAMQKYEALYALEQETLQDDPRVAQEQARVRELMEKYGEKEREIEGILLHLDDLEARTKQQLADFELEDTPGPLPQVSIPEAPIDDFEKAIERRVRARNYHEVPKSVLTAEEFPLTLQLLSARPPSPDS